MLVLWEYRIGIISFYMIARRSVSMPRRECGGFLELGTFFFFLGF
jgi:hypothetical protein